MNRPTESRPQDRRVASDEGEKETVSRGSEPEASSRLAGIESLELQGSAAASDPADESSEAGTSSQSQDLEQPVAGDSPRYTSLRCFALIARHHGVDVSVERLVHDYALETEEPKPERLLRIVKESGFKAKSARLDWKRLRALGDAFPVMARLRNGNYVILVGVRDVERRGERVEELAVYDPLSESDEFLFLDRAKFEAAWDGEVLFLKRFHRLLDTEQPFSLRWFIPEIFRQRSAFTDVAIGALFIHAIALVTPLFFQIVIDKVLVNQAFETLKTITIGIVVALIFDAILDYLRGFLLLHATSKIDVRVATRTFQHMLQLPIQFYEQMTAGVLAKHMQQTSKIREFLTGQLFLTLLDSTALIVFLPILFFYSPTLSFVVLGFSAALAAVIGVLLGPYRRRLEALYQAEGDRQAMLVEAIHGIQTIKALSMEPTQRKKWDERSAESVAMHFKVGKISVTARSLSKLLEKLMTVTIVWTGAQLVFDNQLSIGALVAFQMISGRVSAPLVQLVTLVHGYQEAALSVRMLGHVMNRPVEPGFGRGLRPPIQGKIEFEDVTFRYAAAGPPALDHVSLTIPAGSVVGIVGRSGSGKTTLTRLMQGLYQMQDGLIRVDSIDVREIDLAHLRQNLGVVLQENFLFRGTVRENIAMARSDASFHEIVTAARMAGAAEFIERMPRSYDTLLEENGANLSGGQKQRLAIARALLTDPRILIFDEATSALDPESEAIIQANLAQMARGRTVVIVSHRLSTLTRCDAIVVIERGRIESVGTHTQLLQKSKVYKELWYQQMGRA